MADHHETHAGKPGKGVHPWEIPAAWGHASDMPTSLIVRKGFMWLAPTGDIETTTQDVRSLAASSIVEAIGLIC